MPTQKKSVSLYALISVLVFIGCGIIFSVFSAAPIEKEGSDAENQQAASDVDSCVHPVGVPIGTGYMSIIFTSCPTTEIYNTFVSASSRWSAIISENKITPQIWPSSFDVNSVCSFLDSFHFNSTYETLNLSNLYVFVQITEMDGPGDTLASAGPCFVDTLKNYFPIVGGVLLDSADIEGKETLETVVLHELGHVLGIGTLWDSVAQGGGYTYDTKRHLLQDAIFGTSGIRWNNLPKFTGSNAIGVYQDLSSLDMEYVPLEDGKVDGENFYFDTNKGKGSIDGHWKIETFDNELMVFAIQKNKKYPLSMLTIAALEDMGYAVDYSKAEHFLIPQQVSYLRGGSPEETTISLHNDIVPQFQVKTAQEMRLSVGI